MTLPPSSSRAGGNAQRYQIETNLIHVSDTVYRSAWSRKWHHRCVIMGRTGQECWKWAAWVRVNHALHPGGDHTWEYFSLNQGEIMRACVDGAGGGSTWTDWGGCGGGAITGTTLNKSLIKWHRCAQIKSLDWWDLGNGRGPLLLIIVVEDMNGCGARSVFPMSRNPHIMIPSLSTTPTHKCRHLQGGGWSSGDLKTSALYNNTAPLLIRSNGRKPLMTKECNRGR